MRQALITAEGFAKLSAELDYLWRVERPEICQKVSWAAALGDRSENADYQYNKKRLREIDRRLRYLQKRLPELKVIAQHPQQQGRVYFGAWVTVQSDTQRRVRIVGYDEIFANAAHISVDSPLARALLGKEVGDVASVRIDNKLIEYEILAIEYPT